MRGARHLMVLAAVAASLAAVTPLASASEPYEVTEGDLVHCKPLVFGGCNLHSDGEVTLFFHILGVETTEARCHVELRTLADEDGNSSVQTFQVSPGGHDGNCGGTTMPPCMGSLPWPGTTEKDVDGWVRSHYDLCIAPGEGPGGATCSGEYETVVTESGSGSFKEVQTQTATDVRIGSSYCELSVSQTSEAVAPDGEAVHIRVI